MAYFLYLLSNVFLLIIWEAYKLILISLHGYLLNFMYYAHVSQCVSCSRHHCSHHICGHRLGFLQAQPDRALPQAWALHPSPPSSGFAIEAEAWNIRKTCAASTHVWHGSAGHLYPMNHYPAGGGSLWINSACFLPLHRQSWSTLCSHSCSPPLLPWALVWRAPNSSFWPALGIVFLGPPSTCWSSSSLLLLSLKFLCTDVAFFWVIFFFQLRVRSSSADCWQRRRL